MKRKPSEPSEAKPKRHVEVPFIMIPLDVLRNQDVSAGAKLLFGAIYSLAHLPGGCHCTKDGLATRIGMSGRNVQRLFQELEERGWIRRTLKHHGASNIEVSWKPKRVRVSDKMSKPTSDKMSRGDKMSPQLGRQNGPAKLSPQTSRARATASGDSDLKKKRKGSEPHGSDSLASKKNRDPAPAPCSGKPPPEPDRGEKEDPVALANILRQAMGMIPRPSEPLDEVLRDAEAQGYRISFRDNGALVDVERIDGAKPTHRMRETMTELGRRARRAQGRGQP